MTPELKEKIRNAVHKCIGGGWMMDSEPLKDIYECRDYQLDDEDGSPLPEQEEIYRYEDACLQELCNALLEGRVEIKPR